MLDLNLIRNDAQKVAEALAKKGYEVDFTELLSWDAERQQVDLSFSWACKLALEIRQIHMVRAQ